MFGDIMIELEWTKHEDMGIWVLLDKTKIEMKEREKKKKLFAQKLTNNGFFYVFTSIVFDFGRRNAL
jgi:hypothetical protein